MRPPKLPPGFYTCATAPYALNLWRTAQAVLCRVDGGDKDLLHFRAIVQQTSRTIEANDEKPLSSVRRPLILTGDGKTKECAALFCTVSAFTGKESGQDLIFSVNDESRSTFVNVLIGKDQNKRGLDRKSVV